MIDIKEIKAAAESATPQPWIESGEGNMPFICMLTPATVIALCDEIERLRDVLQHMLSSDRISSGERGLINKVLKGAKQ